MPESEKKPARHLPLKPVLIVVALVLVTFASWWIAGRKVWTDDHGLAVSDHNARLREVLWNTPIPLGDLFEGSQQHYEPSFSPDGTELYFVAGKPGRNADIYVSYRRNNRWSTPEPVAAINTQYDELGPRVTSDGKFLLFYSDRPGGFGGYDIWASARTANGWGKPFNLGPNVNSEFNEFTPDATPDGKHLIFATNRNAARQQQLQHWRATIRENEAADFDLWITELKEPSDVSIAQAITPATQPAAPLEPATAPATEPTTEPGEIVSPIASAVAPAATLKGIDVPVAAGQPATAPSALAIAAVQPTTAPSALISAAATQPTTAPALSAEALSPELSFAPAHEIAGINTPYVEGASCMSPAGDFLYFASNRPGGLGKFDIWRCRVSSDWKFGPVENAGPEINSPDNETDPALAFNGYRLIFSSDRGSDTGVYRLFSSDSREVYAMRQGRPLPQVGRSFWIFIASLLALIPLLLMLRGTDNRKLNILQKCLLISVLAHVLFCLALSFLWVSQDVYHFARQQMGVEVAINLNPSPEMEVGTSIRRQSTASDLPTTGAPPSADRVSQSPLETAIAPGPVDVSLPRASAMPEPLLPSSEVAHAIPPIKASTASAQPIAPNTELPRHDPLDLQFKTPQAVSQAEATPQGQAAASPTARSASNLPQTAPPALPAPIAPTAQVVPSPMSVQPEPLSRPNIPAGPVADATKVAPQVSPMSAAPSVNVPQNTSDKLSGHDAAPAASTAAPNSAAATGPLDSSTAGAVKSTKSDVTPAAGPTRPDAASGTASVVSPGAYHPAAGPVVPNSAAPGTSNLVAPPDIQAPKATAAPLHVASGEPTAPEAQAASAGIARQGTAVANAPAVGVDMPAPHVASAETSALGGPNLPQASGAGRAIAAGPTTLPSQAIASSVPIGPAAPQMNFPTAGSSHVQAGQDRPLSTDAFGGTATQMSGPIAPVGAPAGSAAGQVAGANAPLSQPVGGSFFSADIDPGIRSGKAGVVVQPAGPVASIPGAMEGPQISVPSSSAPALPSPHPAAGGAGANVPEPTAIANAGKQTMHGPEGGGTKNVSIDIPGPVAASAHLPRESGTGLDPISARPHFTEVASVPLPKIDIGLPTDIGSSRLHAPDSPFKMRAPEMHKPIIEKLGGNKESEDAVAKALFWLSENQSEDGHWTIIFEDRKARRGRSVHDTALTGLSLLAYLAQDHRPNKPGPYRQTVERGLDYLVSAQKLDGDLRGDSPGNGSTASNMYDHGIATYAMAEAAILTRDPRYIAAAQRGAEFIVKAQNDSSGGWRYAPRESADTSVFGWQVMALHSAEQTGFTIPEQTRRGIDRYIEAASSGRQKMLAAYQPNNRPTPTMTAQLAFTRMLLGQQLTDAQTAEAADFLSQTPPSAREVDLYYWYYASLCMSQMQTPAWKSWNQKTRDMLIAMQKPAGEHGGYWDSNTRKGETAGRVFSTALGALTLEVYYRYMPLQERNAVGKKE